MAAVCVQPSALRVACGSLRAAGSTDALAGAPRPGARLCVAAGGHAGARLACRLGAGVRCGAGLVSRRCCPRATPRRRAAQLPAAAAAAASTSPEPASSGFRWPGASVAAEVSRAARDQLKAVDGLWGQLLPMTVLFFCMAFVNTLLDAVKDTLVVTAGGVEQLPFLLVYVVFPASIAFLLAFTAISSRCSRGRTFNIVVGVFMSFFIVFGAVLFPLRDTLHPYAFADALAAALPAGLAGGVACVRHWTYTLFYVAAELWGDVVLSLLFWGLANDTTRLHDAPILYPLFGIGANVAQTAAGLCLKALGAVTASLDADAAWAVQLRLLCGLTVGACAGIMALHAWILRRAQAGGTARGAAAAGAHSTPLRRAAAPSLRDSLATVAGSPQIRCLAACALAQGVAQCMSEFAWKGHLRALHPTPTGYAAYMGDVATATGALTALMMLISPVLFNHLGWRGAAGVLPRILLVGGGVFFGGAVTLAHSPPALAETLLPWVVLSGALLFVFSRAAKYALFKPAEEMIYINLDDASRTRGKAAVDVVANQAGKSGGSLFNQGLLLLCAGSLQASLPLMMAAFLACATRWMGAVSRLADIHAAAQLTHPPAAAPADANEAKPAEAEAEPLPPPAALGASVPAREPAGRPAA